MNTSPTDVTVQIKLADGTPITDEIADVWGFGFEGQVMFEDGNIIAKTESPLNQENHVTLLVALDKGILSSIRQEPGSFDVVKEEAFEGSDYDDTEYNAEEVSTFEAVVTTLMSFVLPIGIIIWIGRIKKKRAEKKRKNSQRNSAITGIFQTKEV